MRRIKQFFSLPAAERRLWMHTATVVFAVRMGLLILPFRTLVRLAARASRPTSSAADASRAQRDRIVWAVNSTSKHLPGRKTCLLEALAGQVLLTRRGFPTRVKIGVRKGDDGDLLAHAWLENNGDVVIGGPRSEVERYTVLEDFDRVSLRF